MALFGNLDDLARLLSRNERFRPGMDYLARLRAPENADSQRIRALPMDASREIVLEGGCVAIEQVYLTRSRAQCFFESHRKYIDIQFVLEGEEIIDVLPMNELAVSKPYREEKDVIKYSDAAGGSKLRLQAGQAAIFFPEDGHMPGQYVSAPALVRKTVVKVPMQPPFVALPGDVPSLLS